MWRRCHAFLQERIQKSEKKKHVQKWLSCAILRGRAQKDVLQLTREKKGQKVETEKRLTFLK